MTLCILHCSCKKSKCQHRGCSNKHGDASAWYGSSLVPILGQELIWTQPDMAIGRRLVRLERFPATLEKSMSSFSLGPLWYPFSKTPMFHQRRGLEWTIPINQMGCKLVFFSNGSHCIDQIPLKQKTHASKVIGNKSFIRLWYLYYGKHTQKSTAEWPFSVLKQPWNAGIQSIYLYKPTYPIFRPTHCTKWLAIYPIVSPKNMKKSQNSH